jgi:phytanoyl-CoA hydroxylase
MADVAMAPEVTEFPGELSEIQLDQFQESGYLAFENVLSEEEVADARSALTEITIRLMERAKQGNAKIQERPNATLNYAGVQVINPDSGFGIDFEAGLDPLELSVEEAELKFRKLHGYHQEHPVFVKLALDHPNIIGTMRQIIGEDVALKAEMALSKPPFIGSEKPWHQDNAYFNWLPLEKVATAWIALDDATVENGCMHTIPGGHLLGALKHYHTIDCEILPDRIDKSQAVPVPVKAGGVMFFSAMLPHQTPPNQTAQRRRALQFQYRGVSTKQVSKEEFGKVFADADGVPATCALAHENG